MAYGGLLQIFGPLIIKKINQVDGLEHLPKHPPFIMAANHIGYMDALALALFIKQRYGYSPYFITTPWAWRTFGKFLSRRWLHMIPRQDNKKQIAFDEALERLRSGNVLGIFPEGARNPDTANLLKGKTGAVRFSLATGAPLMPVGIYNTTGQHFINAFKSLWQPARIVRLNFGQPVDLTEFKNKPVDKPLLEAATRKLMSAIGELCHKNYPY